MARIVTSDGVQINLFLDLDSHNTGEGVLLYGPKTQPEMDFVVKGFRNFKTNTELNNKIKLVFHSDVEVELSISDLMAANPTSSSQYTVPNHSDTNLYFVEDDLVLSKTGTKIYRIDLFISESSSVSGTVTSVNNVLPDSSGNVTIDVGSGGGGGFTNMEVFTTSGTWNVPAGVNRIKLTVTGAGENTGSSYGGGAGATAIGVFDVSPNDELIITVSAARPFDINNQYGNSNYSQVSITGKSGYIRGGSARAGSGGYASNSLSGLVSGTSINIRGGSGGYSSESYTGATGGSTIYGSGSAYGGGAGGYWQTVSTDAGPGIVIIEY